MLGMLWWIEGFLVSKSRYLSGAENFYFFGIPIVFGLAATGSTFFSGHFSSFQNKSAQAMVIHDVRGLDRYLGRRRNVTGSDVIFGAFYEFFFSALFAEFDVSAGRKVGFPSWLLWEP